MTDPCRSLLAELATLRKARGSRSFDVQTGDLTTTLIVHDGELVSARASKPGEPIGRILRRKQLIRQDHYVEVLERISEVLAAGDSVRFGEVAVGLGYAKPDDVAECLAAQVRGLVARVFQQPSLTWTAGEAPQNRDASRDIEMFVESIFLDCVRWFDDARKGALGLDMARPRALQAAWDLPDIDQRFELTAEEAEFVRVAVAGDKTVTELFGAPVGDAVDIHSVLTALIATGAVTLKERGAARRHDSPVRVRRVSLPPAWAKVDAGQAKQAITKIKLAKASISALPAIGSFLEQALDAERAFQRGRDFFRAGDIETALRHFERAQEREPSSEEYALFVEWCRHFVAKKPYTQVLAEQFEGRARRALNVNPRLAFGYFVLGEVLSFEGMKDQAKAQFELALRIDPELFEGIARKQQAARNPPKP